MAGNIYVDLSDEIERDLHSGYQDFCNEIAQGLSMMKNDLDQICQETKFEPLVKLVNSTVKLFNGEIYHTAKTAFQEWCEGDGSFSAVVNNSQAGEAALGTAKGLDNKIRDVFDTFWTSHPLGESFQVDTSRPKIKNIDFDNLKTIYDKNSQAIQTAGESKLNSIVTKGEDDPTYKVIIPAYKAVMESVKTAFEQFSKTIEKEKNTSETLTNQQNARNEQAVQTATKTAATAAQIAEAAKAYSDI